MFSQVYNTHIALIVFPRGILLHSSLEKGRGKGEDGLGRGRDCRRVSD